MRVFIVCPSKMATGGTELLHQFSACLKERDIDCYMLYIGEDSLDCPTPEIFMKYKVKYVSQYVDDYDSVVVFPETQVHLIDMCKKGIAMVWWLSVNNYIHAYENEIKVMGADVHSLKDRCNVVNFVQSKYAEEFLKNEIGIGEAYYLKDYINDDIVGFANVFRDKLGRADYCLYNPRKGYSDLKPIIESCRPDIKWIPLQGFKPQEIAALMCRAKVYIDFGRHPGKDRIPREAGISGCCIITNKVGSAAYQEDVNIPEKFKIEDMTDIEAVLGVIYDCVDNYEERITEYQTYRNIIAHEKEEFMGEVDECLEKLKILVTGSAENEVIQIDEQHVIMMDILGQSLKELDWYLDKAKENASDSNRTNFINTLLEMDYLLRVMRENICYEEVCMNEE